MRPTLRWPITTALIVLAVLALWIVYVTPREINLPRSDQWQLSMPLAVSVRQGTFELSDVTALYRGAQRNAVANLVTVMAASVSEWDVRLENRATLIFAVAGALLGAATVGVRRNWLLALFGAALMLSLKFNLVWTLGLYAAWLHGAVFALAALLLAHQPGRGRLAGALACAVAATFSVAGGMAVWPGLGALIVMQRGAGWKPRLLLTILVGLLAVGLYLNGVQTDPDSVDGGLLERLGFILAVLGAPFTNDPLTARIIGLALLATVGVYAVRAPHEQSALPVALAVSAAACAGLISLGRLERGDPTALRGWYGPFTVMLALAVMRIAARIPPIRSLRLATYTGVAILAVLFTWTSLGFARRAPDIAAWEACARAYPVSGEFPCARGLFWGPARVPELADVLIENGLALYAED